MKTRKKYLLSALIIIFLAPFYQGCKKYDEGPAFSLRSKKARLTGEWEVTSYLKNGKDFLIYVDKVESGYDNMCGANYTDISNGTSVYIYEFEKNGDVNLTETFNETVKRVYNWNCSDSTFSNSDMEITFGEWEFRKKKNEIRLEMNYNGSLIKEDYEIVRLTNDELKLKGFIGGGYNNPIEKVEIEFKKK